MRYVPSTIVVAVLALILACWPGVQAWSETGPIHHYLVHLLYLFAGALVGLQTAWWAHGFVAVRELDDGGVSS
ncbi:hypothetical protein [Alicyclobacillus pomorum]|jgi:hypothetical protein|uniref:hypothetical protein n=1 Tax=Alicyclobacillus pomorum TaxID=204470 RepID=UPI000403ECEB|nr:hypothetical protein [Alicyclobacillus pomorum]